MRRTVGLVASLLMLAAVLASAPAAGGQTGVFCDGKRASIVGTAGPDLLIGTAGNDVIAGLGGNDIIRGLDGRDVICGGDGRDRLFGGRKSDRIFGGGNGDLIKGEAGSDFLFGETGNDRIVGGGGNDVLDGGRGRLDRLYGRTGTDSCTDRQAGSTLYVDCEISNEPPPPGDPEYPQFEYVDFDGTNWFGELRALVSVPLSRFNNDDGSCYLLVGSLTPTLVPDGFVSSEFSTPRVGVISGGEYFDDSVIDCDTSAAESAGYGWILDATVTQSTVYPFFAEFFIPAGNPSPSQVVVGSPTSNDSIVYDATPSTAFPPTPPRSPGPPIVGASLVPGLFDYVDFDGTTWLGEITALVTAPASVFNDSPGQCYMVLGSLTPTFIPGGIVSSGFATPQVGVVAGGEYVADGVLDCDDGLVEAAGYGWILDAEVTVGTNYPFFAEIFVPAHVNALPSDVIVGSASDDASVAYRATPMGGIPSP